MLVIKGRDDRWHQWHVGGGDIPHPKGPVITIQADGHELQWLMNAIDHGFVHATKDYYRQVHHTVWEPEDGKYGF